MDSEDIARMAAQVVNGVSKEQSRYVVDEESGAMWDQIAAETDEIRKANPNAQFEIPNEVPTSDSGDGPVMREEGEPAAPAPDAENPTENAAEPAEEPADGAKPPEEKPGAPAPTGDKPVDGATPPQKPEEKP